MKRGLFRVVVLGPAPLWCLQKLSLSRPGRWRTRCGAWWGRWRRWGWRWRRRARSPRWWRRAAGWEEWEEVAVGAEPAAEHRYREEATARVVARARNVSRPSATARVVWLRTRMSQAETSTDPKLLPRSNLVRMALGPPCLRWRREIGPGPARGATKGFLMLRTKLAAGQLAGKAQGARGGQLRRVQGGQLARRGAR